jgi:hypothetical protein
MDIFVIFFSSYHDVVTLMAWYRFIHPRSFTARQIQSRPEYLIR